MEAALATIAEFGPQSEGLLDFGGLSLDSLPEEIERLEEVSALYLSQNAFKEIPLLRVSPLRSLKVLAIDGNKLTKLSTLDCLSNLELVYLDNNKITEFPKGFFSVLPNLRWLSAQNNQITNLSNEILGSTKLEGLRLSCNQLTTLPEDIGNLSALICLDVEHNRLERLPHSIGRLSNLQGLFLEGNVLLQQLPLSLVSLSLLTDFTFTRPYNCVAQETKIVWHVHSLVDICCYWIRRMGLAYQTANIPDELKEKLKLRATSCHNFSCGGCGVFYGERGVAEKLCTTTLCQVTVPMRASYCSHCACTDCLKTCYHCTN